MLASVMIVFFSCLMIATFPYIMGLRPAPSGVHAKRVIGFFYLCPPAIVYFSWWLTRLMSNTGYVRRIRITSASITLNESTLNDPALIRGPVRIQQYKEIRPIEAIRVTSGRRSYIIAAKDDPGELDQIESIIPQPVRTDTSEVELKGVL